MSTKNRRFGHKRIDDSLDEGARIDRDLEEIDRRVEEMTHENYWGEDMPRATPGNKPLWKRSNGKTPPTGRSKK